MVVDLAYLEAAAPSVAKSRSAYRLLKASVAVSAFMIGALIEPSLENIGTSKSSTVPVMLPAVIVESSVPHSSASQALPPDEALMDQQEAERIVRLAYRLRRTGRSDHAQRLLEGVLEERPGHPPALAAMARLSLELGDASRAVHWARRAVQALPGAADHWQLLGDALALSGLHEESLHARMRAAELSRE